MSDLNVSRRGFISAAGAAATLAACGFAGSTVYSSKAKAAEAPKWDDSADVVVCGGGGAGLNAAYRALEQGASVIVLEKAGFTGGTLQFAEGAFQAVCDDEFALDDGTNPVTKNDSLDLMAENWLAMADGDCDEDLIRTLVNKSGEAAEWIKKSFNLHFVKSAGNRPVPFVPADTVADRILYMNEVGVDDGTTTAKPWMDNAAKAVEDAGGKIVLKAEVVEFVTDEKGVVTGVRTLDGKAYEAKKGVICCTGGIDHNEVMAKHVNPFHYWQLKNGIIKSVEANTGEGILAGMALGAQTGFHGTDNNPNEFWIGTNKHMMNLILVGPRGYRFAREDTTYGFWSRCIYYQIRQEGGFDGTVWAIFGEDLLSDETLAAKGSLADPDHRKELEAEGTLVQGKDAAELAAATGLPEEAIAETLERWQKACDDGVDLQFGRDSAMDGIKAPYYACKVYMGTTGAFGGMVIDEQCHVIDYEGKPIPHLFAAGNASAGWLGDFYYGSGTCLMACAALGMIAAENAVAGNYESKPAKPAATGQTDASAASSKADAPAASAADVKDGTYSGEAKGMESTIKVEVTVSGGKISDVKAEGQETQGIGSKALEQLPGAIAEAGTTEGVDAVAGATVTSEAIIKAVNAALESAK